MSVVQPEHEYFATRTYRASHGANASAGSLMAGLDDDARGYKRFLLPPTQARMAQRRMRRKAQQLQQLAASADATKDASKTSASLLLSPPLELTVATTAAQSSSAASGSVENESKAATLSSSSESSSESEEEALADGFRSVRRLAHVCVCQGASGSLTRLCVCSDSKETFVLEIDDETDEDLMSVLIEQELPEVRRLSLAVYLSIGQERSE